MGYDTDKLYKKAKKLIVEKQCIFHSDVLQLLGIAKSTYYDHFPYLSDRYNEIDELLHANKISTKLRLRQMWERSESAALQINLMKLLATDEERRKMSQGYVDVTSNQETIRPQINLSLLSTESLLELKQLYDDNQNANMLNEPND